MIFNRITKITRSRRLIVKRTTYAKMTDDQKFFLVAKRVFNRHREAFRELAK